MLPDTMTTGCSDFEKMITENNRLRFAAFFRVVSRAGLRKSLKRLNRHISGATETLVDETTFVVNMRLACIAKDVNRKKSGNRLYTDALTDDILNRALSRLDAVCKSTCPQCRGASEDDDIIPKTTAFDLPYEIEGDRTVYLRENTVVIEPGVFSGGVFKADYFARRVSFGGNIGQSVAKICCFINMIDILNRRYVTGQTGTDILDFVESISLIKISQQSINYGAAQASASYQPMHSTAIHANKLEKLRILVKV